MALTPDLLTVVRSHLITAGIDESDAWKIYIGYRPDDQDQAILLEPTGGLEQDTHAGENVLPTFQVSIRSGKLGFQAAQSKWWQVFASLNDADLSANNIYLIQVVSTGPISFIDENNRHVLTMNFRVHMKKPVVT